MPDFSVNNYSAWFVSYSIQFVNNSAHNAVRFTVYSLSTTHRFLQPAICPICKAVQTVGMPVLNAVAPQNVATKRRHLRFIPERVMHLTGSIAFHMRCPSNRCYTRNSDLELVQGVFSDLIKESDRSDLKWQIVILRNRLKIIPLPA